MTRRLKITCIIRVVEYFGRNFSQSLGHIDGMKVFLHNHIALHGSYQYVLNEPHCRTQVQIAWVNIYMCITLPPACTVQG